MGCIFSCKRSSTQPKSKGIRIVHLDGYIEEIEGPVMVSQLTSPSQKHFLFSQAQVQLLAVGAVPLKMDHLLEPGRPYFLLPYSLFEASVSPLDLAPVARKLVSMSQSSPSKIGIKKSTVWRSYSGCKDTCTVINAGLPSCKKDKNCNSWKPILASIQEMSLSRRIGSELMDKLKGDDNFEWLG